MKTEEEKSKAEAVIKALEIFNQSELTPADFEAIDKLLPSKEKREAFEEKINAALKVHHIRRLIIIANELYPFPALKEDFEDTCGLIASLAKRHNVELEPIIEQLKAFQINIQK